MARKKSTDLDQFALEVAELSGASDCRADGAHLHGSRNGVSATVDLPGTDPEAAAAALSSALDEAERFHADMLARLTQ